MSGGIVIYALTRAGQDLLPVVDALVEWGAQWSFGERKRSEIPMSN